jgi:hypothetical protein
MEEEKRELANQSGGRRQQLEYVDASCSRLGDMDAGSSGSGERTHQFFLQASAILGCHTTPRADVKQEVVEATPPELLGAARYTN